VTYPVEPYTELVRHYRERWVAHGRDPADALVGAGTAGFHVARASQEALDAFRPIFDQRLAASARFGLPVVFPTLEDFVERSSALVGSPQQVIEKVLRHHEELGHEVIHLHSDGDGLTPAAHRAALELFQAEVAPVLRSAVPSRPLAGPIPFTGPLSTPVSEPVGAR
jgi:alkanesulfonate monooxygenase SsuD/methylene tetrahydromethanopterin reductase-like flavin-dependent oxidoreductase (luciferase family)